MVRNGGIGSAYALQYNLYAHHGRWNRCRSEVNHEIELKAVAFPLGYLFSVWVLQF
jgi:hypothetical protein